MTIEITRSLAEITVQTDGTVIVHEVVKVADGDDTITTLNTVAYAPGDDVSKSAYARVIALCAAVWDSATLTAYAANHAVES